MGLARPWPREPETPAGGCGGLLVGLDSFSGQHYLRLYSAYPELTALVGPQVPDLRGQFLRGLGGKSAGLEVRQGESVYIPPNSSTMTHTGMDWGWMYNLYYDVEPHIDYSNNVLSRFFPKSTFSLKSDNRYYPYRAVPLFHPTSYTSSYSEYITINSGDFETRPENMAVRYLIKALK